MKSTVIAIIAAGVLIGGAIMLSGDNGSSPVNNVSEVDGTQVIEITAKGKYSPKQTTAKADMPTVIRVKTNGTFDCTAGLSISALKYQATLPPTGATDIPVPPQKTGSSIQGLCAMGMFNFTIAFK